MDKLFKTIYNSSEWLKDIKTLKDLEKCPQKYKIKIIDVLYNYETLHNFYIKLLNDNKNKNIYIPTVKSSQIYLNDYFQCLLFLNEILFNNLLFENEKINKTLKNFKYKKSKKFVRLNTNKIKDGELKELIDKYKLTETLIPNVFKTSLKVSTSDNNKLIYQSLGSCFPAYLLNPESDSKVIDACAAPGNKTNHLSCIMKNKGKIIAYEINKTRFETIKKRLLDMNSNNIELKNEDFLDSNIEISPDYILLDPSCSGSGMKNSLENNSKLDNKILKLIKNNKDIKSNKLELIDSISDTKESFPDAYEYVTFEVDTNGISNYKHNIKDFIPKTTKEEVNKENDEIIAFSKEQTKLLEKAMSLNPKKIVYSTCSIYEIENERVIENCLKKYPQFEVERISSSWNTRGISTYKFWNFCLRIYPNKLHTGFFVVVLINKRR